MTYTMTLGAN